MYSNFDAKKEEEAQLGNEWQIGAVTTDIALVPLKERILYLPSGVLQYNNITDSQGCASRGPIATLKTKFNYLYGHGMLPELKNWLSDNGYIKDGKIVFDETYIEILSGTTPTGNSLKAPLEAIRKYGLIPEILSFSDGMTWEQYMDPKRITKKLLDLGQEFNKRFSIAYEQVPSSMFLAELEVDMLDVAAHAWPQPIDDVYQATEGSFNHCFAILNPEIDAFDSYYDNWKVGDFIKRLAKDYKFFPWGYSISITKQTIPDPLSELSPAQTASLWAWLVQMITWIFQGSKGQMPAIPKNLL